MKFILGIHLPKQQVVIVGLKRTQEEAEQAVIDNKHEFDISKIFTPTNKLAQEIQDWLTENGCPLHQAINCINSIGEQVLKWVDK